MKKALKIIVAVVVVLFVGAIVFGGGGSQVSNEAKESAVQVSEPDFKKSCQTFNYKKIARNPDDYVDKPVKIKGEVSQVVSDGYYRVYTDDDWDEEWIVYDGRDELSPKVLEGDVITVYGLCGGVESVERALTGTSDDVPCVEAIYLSIKQANV